MEYWTNLNELLAIDELAQNEENLIARLRDAHVTLAVWTFVPEQLPVAQRVSANGVEVVPVVPNLPAYVRDVTGDGPIVPMVKRFRRLSLGGKTSLLFRNVTNTLSVITRDFGMGLSILTEIELRLCRNLLLRHAVISSAVVDLAVALNNRQLIDRLLRLVQRRLGLSPLLETANLGTTASKLIEWGIDTREIRYMSAVNQLGYGMRPRQELCELVCTSGRATVVGSDIDAAGQLSLEDALSYVQSVGLRACLLPPSRLALKGTTALR